MAHCTFSHSSIHHSSSSLSIYQSIESLNHLVKWDLTVDRTVFNFVFYYCYVYRRSMIYHLYCQLCCSDYYKSIHKVKGIIWFGLLFDRIHISRSLCSPRMTHNPSYLLSFYLMPCIPQPSFLRKFPSMGQYC
jgi:hypothetical protein